MKNTDKKLIIPASVKPGDTIAIVTPASAMESRYIDSLIEKLHDRGFKTKVMPHAYGNEFGTYPADYDKRLNDIMDAFKDSEVKAIICSRGGYGMVHLLPHLNADTILKNPKWFIGFSDISDMHAYLHHIGVASMHGPMAAHIVDEANDDIATNLLFKYLSEGLPQKVEIAPHKYNHNGTAKGRLVGGNLLTLTGLAETPYDVLNACRNEDAILFIEDVSEQIYAVERMLFRMHYAGILKNVKGLIIGQFNDYKDSKDFACMEDMFHYWLEKWGYYSPKNNIPIVFNYPVGHVTENYPMPISAMTTLTADENGVTVNFEE